MHCKSLWIKASAKCINVNVNVILDVTKSTSKTRQRHLDEVSVVCDVTLKTRLCLPSLSELHNSRGKHVIQHSKKISSSNHFLMEKYLTQK